MIWEQSLEHAGLQHWSHTTTLCVSNQGRVAVMRKQSDLPYQLLLQNEKINPRLYLLQKEAEPIAFSLDEEWKNKKIRFGFGPSEHLHISGLENKPDIQKLSFLFLLADGQSGKIMLEQRNSHAIDFSWDEPTIGSEGFIRDMDNQGTFSLMDMMITATGDIYLVGEYMFEQDAITSRDHNTAKLNFSYKDLFAVKISEKKGFQWIKIMKKEQEFRFKTGKTHSLPFDSKGRPLSLPGSFTWGLTESGLHLLYTDGDLSGRKASPPWIYGRLSPDGSILQEPFNSAPSAGMLIPTGSHQIPSGEIMIFLNQGTSFKLGSLEVE